MPGWLEYRLPERNARRRYQAESRPRRRTRRRHAASPPESVQQWLNEWLQPADEAERVVARFEPDLPQLPLEQLAWVKVQIFEDQSTPFNERLERCRGRDMNVIASRTQPDAERDERLDVPA